MIRLSVIIPFLNASDHLPRCLAAISCQTCKNAEFIFVDNGSIDNSKKIIEAFSRQQGNINIQILEEKKRGASAARNTGADHASGEWLLFTDADCIPGPDWLRDITAATVQAAPNISALAGNIKPWPSKNIVATFLGMYTLPANKRETVYNQFQIVSGGFPTANLAVRRDVFLEIGGFDVAILIYGEDHDLCARIYQKRHFIKTLTNAVVYHNHRSDIKGMMKQAFGFGKAHALELRKTDPGMWIVQLPGRTLIYNESESRVWIDLNQAEKKLLGAFIPGILWWPLFFLPLIYFVYLCHSIYRRGKKRKMKVSLAQSPVYVLLLLLKSFSMTVGRLWGSSIYKVICI